MSDLDRQIRGSLERLTAPEGDDRGHTWERIVARRRRRRRRRAALIAVPAAALAVIAAVAISSVLPDDGESVVATNPGEGRTEPTPSTMPTYALSLPGAEQLREESLTASNTDVALWGDGSGAYLSLTVRPGQVGTYGAPSGLGPMVRDGAFPDAAGEAWLSEPEDPRAATMWWVRPSGDLWILRGHWYGDLAPDDASAVLRDWALGISDDDPAVAGYVLSDPGMTLLGFDRAGELPSRSRVWEYDEHEITLLVIGRSSAAGRSNLLARGAPTVRQVSSLGEVWTVGSLSGWIVDADAWATLEVPAALQDRTVEILRALEVDR